MATSGATAMNFARRHVVVTGGTGVLGGAVVGRLLELGATCHVPSFDPRELRGYRHRHDPGIRLVEGIDLTQEDSVRAYYADLPRLWASIHLVGGFAMAPIEDAGGAEFQALMRVNALTAYLCCRAALDNMRKRRRRTRSGGGRIVNVSARPALEPRLGANMVLYAAAKSAVAAITRGLAEEVAADGIWVNAIAPSTLDTPLNRGAMPDADHARWAKVEEVAETVAFLASPENRSTRGAVVPVYGKS